MCERGLEAGRGKRRVSEQTNAQRHRSMSIVVDRDAEFAKSGKLNIKRNSLVGNLTQAMGCDKVTIRLNKRVTAFRCRVTGWMGHGWWTRLRYINN